MCGNAKLQAVFITENSAVVTGTLKFLFQNCCVDLFVAVKSKGFIMIQTLQYPSNFINLICLLSNNFIDQKFFLLINN
jgi:hypothetical protein